MKKFTVKFIASLFGLMVASHAFGGQEGEANIVRIQAMNDPAENAFLIKIDRDDIRGPADCQYGTGVLMLSKNHHHFKELYSMILAAHIAGKPVYFWADVSSCVGGKYSIHGAALSSS